MELRASAAPRRLRADAARNRQRLIDAAATVFAARGLDATLDDIARQAGVNVATAYRHFANKHELARAFLQQTVDGAIAAATEAAAVEDPVQGLTQFLDHALRMMASNRGMVDVLAHAYGSEWFSDQLRDLFTGQIGQLVARGQQAGAIRPDLTANDFVVILPMLSSINERNGVAGAPEPTRRYLALVLAGLRPDDTALPGRAPTDAELRAAFTEKVRASRSQPTPKDRG